MSGKDDTTEGGRDRRAVLRGIGVALAGATVGLAGAVEGADAAGGLKESRNRHGAERRAATQEVDTSLPPGAVLFDLDGDGAYDATVERAPEAVADDARPNPIRITSDGLATVDYAASVVEPEGRPALGDLDRLAYDYRVGPGGDGGRAFGAAPGGAVAGQNETTDRGESDDEGQTTDRDEDADSDGTAEDDDSADNTETAGPGDGVDGGNGDSDGGGNDGGGNDGGGNDGGGNDGSGNGGGGNTENSGDVDAVAPDETFLVVENDEGRHGMYLTYHDDRADAEWRTHDVLARATGDTAGTSGWFEYTADGEGTFDDVVERFGADARLVRVGVGHGDGVTPTTLDAAYGALVVNDGRYRFPVEVARRSAGTPFRG